MLPIAATPTPYRNIGVAARQRRNIDAILYQCDAI
jgi:hypothetical protein